MNIKQSLSELQHPTARHEMSNYVCGSFIYNSELRFKFPENVGMLRGKGKCRNVLQCT